MSEICPDCGHEKAAHPGWGQPCEECPDWLDRCVNDFRKLAFSSPSPEPAGSKEGQAQEWAWDWTEQIRFFKGDEELCSLTETAMHLNALESALSARDARIGELEEGLKKIETEWYDLDRLALLDITVPLLFSPSTGEKTAEVGE